MAKFDNLAPGVLRLSLLPFDLLNVYLLDGVLVDSGLKLTTGRLLAALDGFELTAHALTHGHPDHQGASAAICERFHIPLWCAGADRDAIESGDFAELMPNPKSWSARFAQFAGGPPHPVSRTLSEGDALGGFSVLATPGHTLGHVSYWRESDRVLILGDVLMTRSPVTLRGGLREPIRMATMDPILNRESARKLAALNPALVCFGHGPPMVGSGVFMEFASSLALD